MPAPGGARPEDSIGSDEPVRREAAVAAAATLKDIDKIESCTELMTYLRRVPRTSILLGEITRGLVSEGESEAGVVPVVALDIGSPVEESLMAEFEDDVLLSEILLELEMSRPREGDVARGECLPPMSPENEAALRGRSADKRLLGLDAMGGGGVGKISVGCALGTSVVWTTPWTTTIVPGGGNRREGGPEPGSVGCGAAGVLSCDASASLLLAGSSIGLITTSSSSSSRDISPLSTSTKDPRP
jgi:hypothetical protein